MIDLEFSFFEKFLMNIGWYRLTNFFENWIFPAYHLRNFLFHRYDLIKIKNIKPYEYAEPNEIMFEANMILIKKFIEEYKPEKHICWYEDEDGLSVGRKYGEYEDEFIVFPEYRGEYIMDMIKEIYNFYTKTYPEMQKDVEYISEFVRINKLGEFKFVPLEEDKETFKLLIDKSQAPQSINELKNVKMEIFNKFIDKKDDILDYDKLMRKKLVISKQIEAQKNHYLYLCVAVRPYLWT